MKILVLGDENGEILTKIAEAVNTDEIETLDSTIDEMIEVARDLNAAGLAAPQVGINKQIFVVAPLVAGADPLVCINPKIIGRTGKTKSINEGCLSVPGKKFTIKRSRYVKIQYIDRNGQEKTLKPRSKLLNIAIQHEMDHLRGKLVCHHK